MFKVVVLGLVSIAAAAVAPTNTNATSTAATASPTTTAVPCITNKDCQKKGFLSCIEGTCHTKRCYNSNDECDKSQICHLGVCDDNECQSHRHCHKRNLSMCADYKCVGEPFVPAPPGTAASCTTHDSCLKYGLLICSNGTCESKMCETDQECQNYDKTKPFCVQGGCMNVQCLNDFECNKYNLSACLNGKCGGGPSIPLFPPNAIPCNNLKVCNENGFDRCFEGKCISKFCETDQECQAKFTILSRRLL